MKAKIDITRSMIGTNSRIGKPEIAIRKDTVLTIVREDPKPGNILNCFVHTNDMHYFWINRDWIE